MQHCVVRQRLNRSRAHKRRELQVMDTELAPVAFQIRPEQVAVLMMEGFERLELADPRNLLGENTMQLGIDTVGFDRDSDQLTHPRLQRLGQSLLQLA